MCQHLSFLNIRKTVGVHAKVKTGLGKSDCPGLQGGLWKHEYDDGQHGLRHIGDMLPYPKMLLRAPYFYPDLE